MPGPLVTYETFTLFSGPALWSMRRDTERPPTTIIFAALPAGAMFLWALCRDVLCGMFLCCFFDLRDTQSGVR